MQLVAWLVPAVLAAYVAGGWVGSKRSGRPDASGAWALGAACVAVLLALAVAVSTHVDPDWRLCSESTVAKTSGVQTETTEESGATAGLDSGKVTSRRVDIPASSEVTETCAGLTPTAFVPLLLPAALLALPYVRSIDLGGVLKIDLGALKRAVAETNESVREVRESLAVIQSQSAIQRVTVNLAGSAARGAAEARADEVLPVADLPDE